MKQAIIIAAVSATAVQAAPRSARNGGGGRAGGLNAKLRNDRKFLSHASDYNLRVEDTAEFLKRQKLYHETDEYINTVNAK